MGNTPSKAPGQPGFPAHPSGHGNESRVNRRRSIQALSGSKASVADPSPSKESATGQYATHRQHTPVQQRLLSRRGSETPSRTVDRSERPEQRDSKKGRQADSRTLPSHYPSETTTTTSSTAEPSRAVQVPPTADPSSTQRHEYGAYGPPLTSYYATSSHLARPPRLPLPIGDAMTAPGSPITASGSVGTAGAFDKANLEVQPEKSGLGDLTLDDDEMAEELDSYDSSGSEEAVPVPIEWRYGGEKVFVTGTFVNWSRKFKLHEKSENQDGFFSGTLLLRPGTHHLKFIVDGLMRTADDLPTAVDFTNHLVNYVEVSAEDLERSRRERQKQPKITIPPDIYPPKVIPESIQREVARQAEEEEEADKPEEEIPMGDFRDIIPPFLVDVDQEEDTPDYQEAATILNEYPTPPMLPLFLGRSILNGTTPMKDDNSVLNYPNHTVLNHLATSSIKNGVLATSVTTRYKRKYVTTILYKPTE